MSSEKFDFDNAEQVKAKLQELLDRNIPKMTIEKMVEHKAWLKPYYEKATEAEIKAANEHLGRFCELGTNGGKDIFTDEEVCLTWGLRHGELTCCYGTNGMDRRGKHYIVLGGKEHEIDMALQYHPTDYYIDEESEEEE